MAESLESLIPTVIWRVGEYVGDADVPEEPEQVTEENVTNSTPFHWSEDITKKFILLRHEKRNYFCGKRFLTQKAWTEILVELGIDKQLTIPQARKKWGNLVLKYKQLKGLPTQCNSPLPGRDTAETWPYFDIMDEVMGRPPSVIKPMSVVASASLPKDKKGKHTSDGSEFLNPVNSKSTLESDDKTQQNSVNSLLVFESADGSVGDVPYQTFQIMLEDGAEVDAAAIRELLEQHAEATLVTGTGEDSLLQDASSLSIEGAAGAGGVSIQSSSGTGALPEDMDELLNISRESTQEEADQDDDMEQNEAKANDNGPSGESVKRSILEDTDSQQEQLPLPKRMKLVQKVDQQGGRKSLQKHSTEWEPKSHFLSWLQDSMQRSNERQATFESQGHRLNQLFDELVELVRSQKKKDQYHDDDDEEEEEEDLEDPFVNDHLSSEGVC